MISCQNIRIGGVDHAKATWRSARLARSSVIAQPDGLGHERKKKRDLRNLLRVSKLWNSLKTVEGS